MDGVWGEHLPRVNDGPGGRGKQDGSVPLVLWPHGEAFRAGLRGPGCA